MPKNQQKVKRWFLFCEPCSNKQIIERFEETDLLEVPRAKVPGGSPRYDGVKKKTVLSSSTSQPRMFKCPSCGRGCVCKSLPDVYADAYGGIDEKTRIEKIAEEKRKRIEDGIPLQRQEFGEDETEFTG